jgi:hypothetical protein
MKYIERIDKILEFENIYENINREIRFHIMEVKSLLKEEKNKKYQNFFKKA